MPRLFLFDNRVSNVVPTSLLPPPPDVFRITGETERLDTLISTLAPSLSRQFSGLVLIAHANSGELQFTANDLNATNVQAFSAWRRRITGSVEIHGCAIASAQRIELYTRMAINSGHQEATPGSFDTPLHTSATPSGEAIGTGEMDGPTSRMIRAGRGARFLIAFAAVIGLRVTGALHAQEPSRDWRYRGPTMTASPGGSLVIDVPRNSRGFDRNTETSVLVGW